MLGPIIEGERVRLEPPRAEYFPSYERWFADMEVTRYLLYRFPFTPKAEAEWLEEAGKDPHQVIWAIVLRHNGKLIGNTAIEKIDWRNRRGETGIVIGEKDEWGKGYASEAMRLRTRYGFRELGLESLTTHVIIPNDGSRRGLERAGYRQCGVRRHYYFIDGRWHDAWMGEVLRDEWEAAQEAGR
ncbi:MAG TPA: GNAT family protein [Methylomirabilota bacterium]|nr:GNAT family protein [Methylomirabilota bacterium]